jgi:hypothetical protein
LKRLQLLVSAVSFPLVKRLLQAADDRLDEKEEGGEEEGKVYSKLTPRKRRLRWELCPSAS